MTPEAIEQMLERARQAQAGFAAFIQREAPTARIIDLLDDIHLAFIAADTMAIRKRVGWLGRLLGRDIDVQAEAELLRTQGPLLIHRAGLLPMLAQTGIVDAIHKDHHRHASASEALKSLDALKRRHSTPSTGASYDAGP